ncbi:2-dehydro-3-deoxygalactonokinase [Chitinophaga sp. 22321]|uniref:2-dehydro-3-deoxygalactonokinase n=1 Tax=Chitinophaga TaxID=79328 RepID=UPI003F696B46
MMNNKLKRTHFLSCDWGTSSFRLRLVEAGSGTIIADERSDTGIARTYRQWQQTPAPREGFFADFINRQIAALEEKTGMPLQEVPVVLSGMASSSIGMIELPYRELPFRLSGTDLAIHTFSRFTIISGACSDDDVMRGEETKAVGCAAWLPDMPGEQCLLMPGTHPKHIIVSNHQVVRFQTFLTGEFFDLLSSNSVLAASINNEGALHDPASLACFTKGLYAAQSGNLLHTAFMVRTNQLLRKIDPAHNRFYLSGLLIGTELKAIPVNVRVYLVSGPLHTPLYTIACQVLNIPVAAVIDADDALIRGQLAVMSNPALY